MANAETLSLHDSSEETASAEGEAVDIGETRTAVELAIRVTDLTGSVKFELETSPDGSDGWRVAWSKAAITRPGQLKGKVDELERFVRIKWTLAGASAAATFAVSAEAHTLYATREHLFNGELPIKSLNGVDNEVVVQALIDASTDAEDALAASNALPLESWPSSLSRRCAALAAYQVMRHRGFKPDSLDELIVTEAEDAEKWLEKVAAGKRRPPGLQPATRLGPQTSSGNPRAPDRYRRRMSDNWGDFG